MIEPEMAFADLNDNMDLGENLVKNMTSHVMENCKEDLGLFSRFVDKSLISTLEAVIEKTYARISYTEAIDILKVSGKNFEFPVNWGVDIQTEHERYLCEEHFKKPVIVYDYPKEIKSFYMRLNEDNKTVAAMDLLVPKIGELIGGSQREERYDVLKRRMIENDMNLQDYWWYMDIRKFGTVPHAGFGLGFERFLMMVTGVSNIRDVIPFPRTPRHVEF
jgi:asparaginyl-tRNA synthetase